MSSNIHKFALNQSRRNLENSNSKSSEVLKENREFANLYPDLEDRYMNDAVPIVPSRSMWNVVETEQRNKFTRNFDFNKSVPSRNYFATSSLEYLTEANVPHEMEIKFDSVKIYLLSNAMGAFDRQVDSIKNKLDMFHNQILRKM